MYFYEQFCQEYLHTTSDKTDFNRQFSHCKNDYDRVEVLLKNNEYINFIIKLCSNIVNNYDKKCSIKAVEQRKLGNIHFSKDQFQQSLTYYNQSILYATHNSEEIRLAYGNRSASLFHLNKFQLAIDDILLALENGEDDEKRKQRLNERLNNCRQKLLINSSSSLTLNDKPKEDLSLELEKNIIELNSHSNSKYPSFDNTVDIRISKDKGRYVACAHSSSEMKPGKIVMIEKPYASVLLTPYFETHCSHCLYRLYTIWYPCRKCITVRYCSTECEQTAWTTYHQYECCLISLILKLEKMQFLGLRVMTKTKWQFFQERKDEFMNYLKYSVKIVSEKMYEWNQYENILQLESHSNDRDLNDLLQRTIIACIIGYALSKTNYFLSDSMDNCNDNTIVDENLIYLCSLLARHLQSLPCNAHEISEYIEIPSQPLSSHTIELGAGIYCSLSLFNHSCDPAVIRNFIGDTVLVRLLKTVESNDELSDNYGQIYAISRKKERQTNLYDQYYFKCSCTPCIQDWVIYDQLPDEPRFRQNVSKNEFDELYEKYQKSFQNLIDGHLPSRNDQTVFETFLHFCDRYVEKPWKIYNGCQEAYKQCLSSCHHSKYIQK
ncbi:unnamed protein product [Didymodactylos carnosus]|uniref:MYND-type domain-containing protein n=1 Tax=Didymodactylos carnosus TaxID=1234261 RepID=A0A814YIG1_9BILA|nr:unnamed protein product [Didymodactylos carnosus]CAF3992671.1 unnamed protein product [Didymodactylos carnosus]